MTGPASIFNRCLETTSTTGTGTLTLSGAVNASVQSFNVVGDGNTCQYVITDNLTYYEKGIGTFTLSGRTLARTTIIETWNGTTLGSTAYSIPAGTNYVFIEEVPLAVAASGRQTAQTAADASVATFTVGSLDASFVVSANVNVTTATTHSFTVTCTYTDETNTSRTTTFTFTLLATQLTAITNVTGVGAYEGVPQHIRAKGGTTITIATTGTFTAVVYSVEGYITKFGV
jgi:hypothetical protein